jgi:hypothetical protein
MPLALLIAASIVAFVLALLGAAEYRWQSRTSAALDCLARSSAAPPAARYSETELEGLPAPVARYFRAVLTPGQPMISRARIEQRGIFLTRAPDTWQPFTAVEHFVTRPGGFLWDARIRMAPGVAVRVRDSFVEGTGSMVGSVMGLVPVIRVEGTPDIAAGALHRYLAELAWLPTALLPSQGVKWAPIDDTSARATLTVGSTTVQLDVSFGADGLMARAYTPERARDVNGRGVPTPWQGRFTRYERRGSMLIPVSGEVEWILPEGAQPYWRGEIVHVTYETA